MTNVKISLGEETRKTLEEYKKYLVSTGGTKTQGNFIGNIGICGNTSHIGFNYRIFNIFLMYLSSNSVAYKQSHSNDGELMLTVTKSSNSDRLGINPKMYDKVIVADVFFFNNYKARVVFVNWILSIAN